MQSPHVLLELLQLSGDVATATTYARRRLYLGECAHCNGSLPEVLVPHGTEVWLHGCPEEDGKERGENKKERRHNGDILTGSLCFS